MLVLLSACGAIQKEFRGLTGASGQSIVGATGSQGVQGNTGSQGIQGNVGATGAVGQNGSSCSVASVTDTNIAPNGGSLITCSDGTSSLVLNGSQGEIGLTGSQGVAGENGTVITPIQFCPGVTPTYPNNFPEVGFLINGTIYAVYSDHGGFMAALTPGQYSSDGINASCTFTVNNNGTISQ
jgi:hypothetical protein